jgi:hypothetical protein
MKTFSNYIFIIITFIILFISQVYSQTKRHRWGEDDPTGTIRAQVISAVQAKYGPEYTAGISVLDSAIAWNNSTYDGGELTDPYGTLKGCTLFSVWKIEDDDEEHGIMGLYKNGQIIWCSDPIFKDGWKGIYAIKDINRDGKVEILVDWTPGRQLIRVSHLWIISWDGSKGSIINQTSPISGNTIIHASESMYDLFEIDTSSAMVIRSDWPGPDMEDFSEYFPNNQIQTYPYVTYSWNGSLYGVWPNTRQIPGDEYLPANHLSVSVNCVVKNIQDSLSFQYYWSNSANSRQRMATFNLVGVKKSFLPFDLVNWRFIGRLRDFPVAGWEVFAAYEYNVSLQPGKAQNGILLHAQALPGIVNYHAQGFRNPADWGIDNPNYKSRTEWDLFNNAYIGKTIGPIDPSNPFVPLGFLDTLISYTTQSRALDWIKDQATANKYLGYIASAKTTLQQNNLTATRTKLQQVLQDVNVDSTSHLTTEAYALIRYNTEYLLAQLPTAPPPGCAVKLINSAGTKLIRGALQYYEGSWKDAVNNNDGTFFVNTTKTTLSLRMTYEYGSQTKSNVAVGYDTVAFQTVNAQIQLQNSSGVLIDTGSVQYYAGAWRNLGTTTNGIATKDLLPNTYSFRMTYAYASKDKQQDISTNPTVVFQTVNASVQLQNSQGALMSAPSGDQGTVQYYSGAWRDLGATTNGVANKELLPNNYSFRMTYAFASKDKQQDISTNATVVFQTVNAAVQLQNSQGSLIDQGTVQYYSGAWRDLGTTTNGVANKELLPNNYSFRMTYAFASKDKQQDLSTNPTVVFQTVNATVQLKNSLGNLMPAPLGDQGTVQYYSGAWRTLGTTTNGTANKELLPNSYSFRMMYEYVSLDKSQDISTNNTVSFLTVLCTIRVKNSQNQLVDNALASYYSGAWRQIGNTIGGVITKELLPVNLSFRVKYGTQQQDKQQNLSTNNVVEFGIQ